MLTVRVCATPGCPVLVQKGHCPTHTSQLRKVADSRRPNTDIRRLYKTARWEAYRRQKRSENPLCVDCHAQGINRPWDDLDHQIPHRGDLELFWDYDNLVGRCHRHHAEKTGRGE